MLNGFLFRRTRQCSSVVGANRRTTFAKAVPEVRHVGPIAPWHAKERSGDGRACTAGSARVPDVATWSEKALDIVEQYRNPTFITPNEVSDGFVEADAAHRENVV